MRTISTCIVATMLCLVAGAAAGQQNAAPSYAGDLASRSTLTGDWGGVRDDMAAKGVTIKADLTQTGQGVVDGGVDDSWEYGGRADVNGQLDTGKMGWWPGGFLDVELEGVWAESVNPHTGALLPADTNHLFPEPGNGQFGVPRLSFTQFLSKYGGVSIGKMQTVSTGDLNEFAHGKGDDQFFNVGLNVNPVLLIVPYSTLGVVGIVLPTADPMHSIVTAGVLSATGKASEAGFDDIDGAIFAAEGRLRTGFFGRTGHQVLGGFYSNKTYTSLDQRLGFAIQNRALVPKSDTWAMYYNFDQFVYEIDAAQGRGVGIFGRFGASAGNPNPVQYFYSLGVGGKGVFESRAHDRFGIGAFYASVKSPTLQSPIGLRTRSFLEDEWGFEMYYNIALTPWLLLTPDLQVVSPAQRRADTATILGFRLQTIF